MGKGVMTAGTAAVGLIGLTIAAGGSPVADEGHTPSGVRELFVPADWEGRWSIRVETRDPATGALTAVDEGAASICGGDAVGLSLYLRKDEGTGCTGTVDGEELALNCTPSLAIGQCRVAFSIDASVTRTFDTIAGMGEWRIAEAAGDCADVLAHSLAGESLRLAGMRTDAIGAECSAPPLSLVEKLLPVPELVGLMPAPVGSLEALREGSSIRLRWAESRAKAYEIQRSMDGGRFRPIAEVAGHLHTFRDRNLERHREYRYVVRSIAPDGRVSPVSNEVRVQL